MEPIEIIASDLFDKVRSRFRNLEMGDLARTDINTSPKIIYRSHKKYIYNLLQKCSF